MCGANCENENSENYVRKTLDLKLNCEIDVWNINNEWFLGHDTPQYKTTTKFLKLPGLWCHAKNLLALEKLLKMNIVCFWHQKDSYTLTSNGFIWTYSKKPCCKNSIYVSVKQYEKIPDNIAGVCSDYLLPLVTNQKI